MKGLQTLNVKLDVYDDVWGSINKVTAKRIMAPIKEVTAPKTFILSLPFPAMDGTAPKANLPWTITEGWDGVDPWDELPCTIWRTTDTRDL